MSTNGSIHITQYTIDSCGFLYCVFLDNTLMAIDVIDSKLLLDKDFTSNEMEMSTLENK